ncbi:hypothetical protein IW261DRAFT_1426628 [Armillaria novae-zelandiae]|uniref:Uncharacterized protein n=1 Tax=Armillaria novae-zelandiae TaxID=153914 RepID=A0AA39TV63_9AGAR|nr:hypothetical protein IW261DRAFT_1426628 [Armillaria novae-zelandiae]
MPSNPHLESDTFCFGPMDRVLMGWTEAEVRGLSNRLANDPTTFKPLQWGAALIRWVFNTIWFCDNTRSLRKSSGLPVKWMWAKRMRLLHKLESVLEWERRPGLRLHPREAAWDRIMAASGQIVAGYRALQYELQNYGPFNEADIEHLLTNHFPESALDEGHAGPGN